MSRTNVDLQPQPLDQMRSSKPSQPLGRQGQLNKQAEEARQSQSAKKEEEKAQFLAVAQAANRNAHGVGQCSHIYDEDMLAELLADLSLQRLLNDYQRREQTDYLRLLKTPSWRYPAPLASDWKDSLRHLAEEQPNLSDVILRFLMPEIALSNYKQQKGYIHAPLLLIGPPGCGKSMLSLSVGRQLEVPSLELKGEAMQSSATLTGADRSWANAQPGSIFNFMVRNRFGNELVLIDEIDKASTSSPYPVMNGLYALLERITAREFRDQSVPDIAINASALSWIFTANSLESIPAPLQDRMAIFHISALTRAQARDLAGRTFERTTSELIGTQERMGISSEALDILEVQSPRAQARLIRLAIGAALLERAGVVRACHLQAESQKTRSIGFV